MELRQIGPNPWQFDSVEDALMAIWQITLNFSSSSNIEIARLAEKHDAIADKYFGGHEKFYAYIEKTLSSPQRIVIAPYADFSLSDKAFLWLLERSHPAALNEFNMITGWFWNNEVDESTEYWWINRHLRTISRDDPMLIECVETLRADAAGFSYDDKSCAELVIVEIPAGVRWHICSYESNCREYIEEDHRVWVTE